MRGEDDEPGSCPAGESSNPTSVRLVLVDDDGDTIIDSTSEPIICRSGQIRYVKFPTRFEAPENCKDSVFPVNFSRGDVATSVTTIPDNGSLMLTRSVLCKGGGRDR